MRSNSADCTGLTEMMYRKYIPSLHGTQLVFHRTLYPFLPLPLLSSYPEVQSADIFWHLLDHYSEYPSVNGKKTAQREWPSL